MEIFGICKKESRIKSCFDEFWIFAVQLIHVFEYYHNWAVISQFWEVLNLLPCGGIWWNLFHSNCYQIGTEWENILEMPLGERRTFLKFASLPSCGFVAQSLNSIWGYGFGSHQNQNFFRVFFSASAKIATHLWYSFLTSWNCNLMTFIMKLHNY